MEIAIISTKEVLFDAPLQKKGKIKVTLKVSQNYGTWDLDVKYFGIHVVTKTVTNYVQTGVNDENGQPIFGNVDISQTYDEIVPLREKMLTKSDQEMNMLFQAVGKSILPNEFPYKFYEIQKDALLMYIRTDFINLEEPDEAKRVCIFGLKPEEFIIYNE
jgi:hypothetical protein